MILANVDFFLSLSHWWSLDQFQIVHVFKYLVNWNIKCQNIGLFEYEQEKKTGQWQYLSIEMSVDFFKKKKFQRNEYLAVGYTSYNLLWHAEYLITNGKQNIQNKKLISSNFSQNFRNKIRNWVERQQTESYNTFYSVCAYFHRKYSGFIYSRVIMLKKAFNLNEHFCFCEWNNPRK